MIPIPTMSNMDTVFIRTLYQTNTGSKGTDVMFLVWYNIAMKTRATIIAVLLLMLWITPVLAQTGQTTSNDPQTIESLVVSLYNGSVRIVGLAAFLMILYAGILRLIGRGSESNAIIFDAIVGTVLLLSAVIILNSINPDLTRQSGSFQQNVSGANRPAGSTRTLPTSGAILPIFVQ